MRRAQKDSLVAEAIVQAERWGSEAAEVHTVEGIVERYGLRWGAYGTPDRLQDRAAQLVRRALNKAFHDGELCKLRDITTGRFVREGRSVVFVEPWARPLERHGVVEFVWGNDE